jgi:hypothetical protein
MWIGRMGALVTKLPGVVNVFCRGLSEKGRGLVGRPWADAPVSWRVSACQDFAIRPKPGSQQSGAR